MTIFKNKFFRTKEEAKDFQKNHGGALYSNVKGSRTKKDYRVELAIIGRGDEEFANEFPFVVAWTVSM